MEHPFLAHAYEQDAKILNGNVPLRSSEYETLLQAHDDFHRAVRIKLEEVHGRAADMEAFLLEETDALLRRQGDAIMTGELRLGTAEADRLGGAETSGYYSALSEAMLETESILRAYLPFVVWDLHDLHELPAEEAATITGGGQYECPVSLAGGAAAVKASAPHLFHRAPLSAGARFRSMLEHVITPEDLERQLEGSEVPEEDRRLFLQIARENMGVMQDYFLGPHSRSDRPKPESVAGGLARSLSSQAARFRDRDIASCRIDPAERRGPAVQASDTKQCSGARGCVSSLFGGATAESFRAQMGNSNIARPAGPRSWHSSATPRIPPTRFTQQNPGAAFQAAAQGKTLQPPHKLSKKSLSFKKRNANERGSPRKAGQASKPRKPKNGNANESKQAAFPVPKTQAEEQAVGALKEHMEQDLIRDMRDTAKGMAAEIQSRLAMYVGMLKRSDPKESKEVDAMADDGSLMTTLKGIGKGLWNIGKSALKTTAWALLKAVEYGVKYGFNMYMWITSDPTTAMFHLTMIRMLMKHVCKEISLGLGKVYITDDTNMGFFDWVGLGTLDDIKGLIYGMVTDFIRNNLRDILSTALGPLSTMLAGATGGISMVLGGIANVMLNAAADGLVIVAEHKMLLETLKEAANINWEMLMMLLNPLTNCIKDYAMTPAEYKQRYGEDITMSGMRRGLWDPHQRTYWVMPGEVHAVVAGNSKDNPLWWRTTLHGKRVLNDAQLRDVYRVTDKKNDTVSARSVVDPQERPFVVKMDGMPVAMDLASYEKFHQSGGRREVLDLTKLHKLTTTNPWTVSEKNLKDMGFTVVKRETGLLERANSLANLLSGVTAINAALTAVGLKEANNDSDYMLMKTTSSE
jgi:hypothetical protein